MKRALLVFLVLSLSLNFVVAETYEGDGSYSLNKGDSVTLDNSYKLMLTDVKTFTMGSTNEGATYYFDIYKGNSKLTNMSFNSYNFGTSNYSIGVSGERIAEITFTAEMNPDQSQVTITSFGDYKVQETSGQETQKLGNNYSGDVEKPGFFKITWTWFKCLFSRTC